MPGRPLYLLRHAKSGWDQPLPDHDRPLAERGRRDAAAVGRRLAAQGWRPDLVLCSTAVRTQQTWQRAEEAGAQAGAVRPEPRIYAASAQQLLTLVHQTPESVASLMLIGHGPGLPELAERLAGTTLDRVPTSTLLRFEIDGPWALVASGALLSFDVPRG